MTDELEALVRDGIAPYKDRIVLVSELPIPKAATDKIPRFTLRCVR